MLVRGGVKDDGRPVLLEDLPHLRRIPGVCENGGCRVEVALVDELALDLEEAGLTVVHEHQPRGSHAGDLAAELRPDRAPGAGHEHDLAGEVARDRGQVHLDRLAPEQVLHLDRPDLAREVEVAGDELVERRKRLHRHVRLSSHCDDPLAHVTRGRRDRDEQLVRMTLAKEPRQLVGRPQHAHSVQAQVLLARVVVDETDRRVSERRVAQHLAQHQLRGITGSDDHHLTATRDD